MFVSVVANTSRKFVDLLVVDQEEVEEEEDIKRTSTTSFLFYFDHHPSIAFHATTTIKDRGDHRDRIGNPSRYARATF